MGGTVKIWQLEALIAQSKQITADLMTLRHELQRALLAGADRQKMSMAKDRLSLATHSAYDMGREMHELWELLCEESKIMHAITLERPALLDGKLRLTKGGR